MIDAVFVARRCSLRPVVVGLALALPAFSPDEVCAQTVPVVVANCNDAGPGSLREAAASAVGTETIDLSQLTCGKISLTTGAIAFSLSASKITLSGPGASHLTIDGGAHDRVLVDNNLKGLTIDGLTIANGSYVGGAGGCVRSSGNVYLSYSVVTGCTLTASGNKRAIGGGVYALSAMQITHSTISNNRLFTPISAGYGGGAGAWQSINIYYSTISDNAITCSASLACKGGGFFTGNSSDISMSTISGNRAGNGAGGFSNSIAFVGESTFSGNTASGAGGGLYAARGGAWLTACTIAENMSGFDFGAGVYLAEVDHKHATSLILSTILANNTSEDGLRHADLGGSIFYTQIAGQSNIIMSSTVGVPSGTDASDPLLAPLTDNGGPTKTHALLSGSPAINMGYDPHSQAYDQRGIGFARVADGMPDIGAFESGINDRIFGDGFE